jgi:threonine synthase
MTVRYKSTRGGEANLSFEEVVLTGLATDRGLCVPETVPQITMDQLEKVGDSGVVMF